MILDTSDTIVAVSSAPGGAARGVVRLSGPNTIKCLDSWCSLANTTRALFDCCHAEHLLGELDLGGELGQVPCRIFLWPDSRSYTRQETAELHTLGSPALLEAAVHQACKHGARLAQPGEFTLRAFLAGRLDLTQAEAVLGLIDASDSSMLATALNQLAGGLSGPLTRMRELLLQTLARLEAGLDFVEEDIEFISAPEILASLQSASQELEKITATLNCRGEVTELPRVVLVGPPNAGKSSLYNALLQRNETATLHEQAIVSGIPGTTRDYLTAEILVDGLHCQLVDTAGTETRDELDILAAAAQQSTSQARSRAACCVVCQSAEDVARLTDQSASLPSADRVDLALPQVHVLTKSDLLHPTTEHPGWHACSSFTGAGLTELCHTVAVRLGDAPSGAGLVQPTLVRCRESLLLTAELLNGAAALVQNAAGDELVAAEIRQALHELGAVVGTVYTDDVLDRIFSQFCIGK